MPKINCLICGKEKYHKPYRIEKFCSHKCYWISKKGKPSWNKGIKRWWKSPTEFKKGHPAPETAFKKGHPAWSKGKKRLDITGEKHFFWKGENAGYISKHKWIRKLKGKPIICEHCGLSKKNMQWANINHSSSKNPDDYISLCVSCHTKYDFKQQP